MNLNPNWRLLLFAVGLFASCLVHAADNAAPTPATPGAAAPAPPPDAPAKRSAADLEKLVAPIALYPDPLLATLLPASVYPLEIVQAARFVADTNNLAKLDEQSWDDSVKAVARVPDAIKKLNEDISWTIELGEAFLAQDKDLMDAIQAMRGKAQKAGTLQTTAQQVVVVTNVVVEKTVEQQVVVVTNTVVEIQPSNPEVVYVPTYPPTVYYPPPGYVYNPVAPLMTFTAGVAMGAIIANNCDWNHGGCYNNVNIDVDRNVNRNVNRNSNVNTARSGQAGAQKKWQPDQSRLSKSGSPSASASARSAEARGWSSGGARPSTGNSGARPSPSAGAGAAARPSPSAGAARPGPSPNPSANLPSPSSSPSRPSSGESRQSAFDGGSGGASAQQSSSRGAASRGGGGGRSAGGRGR